MWIQRSARSLLRPQGIIRDNTEIVWYTPPILKEPLMVSSWTFCLKISNALRTWQVKVSMFWNTQGREVWCQALRQRLLPNIHLFWQLTHTPLLNLFAPPVANSPPLLCQVSLHPLWLVILTPNVARKTGTVLRPERSAVVRWHSVMVWQLDVKRPRSEPSAAFSRPPSETVCSFQVILQVLHPLRTQHDHHVLLQSLQTARVNIQKHVSEIKLLPDPLSVFLLPPSVLHLSHSQKITLLAHQSPKRVLLITRHFSHNRPGLKKTLTLQTSPLILNQEKTFHLSV